MSAWDSNGLSGGTLISWNPQVSDFRDFITDAGILMVGFVQGYSKILMI